MNIQDLGSAGELIAAVATPGGAFWWETTGRPIFVKRMVAVVDQRVAEGENFDMIQRVHLNIDKFDLDPGSGAISLFRRSE